jgi:hypothetical protein
MDHPPLEAGADDVHAHPRHTGHRWFDITMAMAAIFISLVSLVVAVEHGRTERDLVAASSWPFPRLLLSDEYNSEHSIAIGLSNGGTGPAKIHSFEMWLGGQPITSPVDLLQRCCGLPHDSAGIHRAIPAGLSMSAVDSTVLRPGEDNAVLIFRRVRSDRAVGDRLDRALTRLRFRVCYCSVLDQCWTTDLKSLDTPAVRRCPAPEHPYRYADRNG